MAAKLAWHSQIMPPSPMTMVKDRKITANASPVPSRVSQYPLSRIGSNATIAMTMIGPSMYSDHPDRDAMTAALAEDFAVSMVPPWGRMARSSAPPVEAASFTCLLNAR